jgi:hypothetical protein
MRPVDIFIRYSDLNAKLDKVATLSAEDNLIYNDDGGDFKAHLKTTLKFAMLTAGSPLIALARLVRSAVFAFTGAAKSAGREFIGALTAPLVTAGCLVGSLLSCAIYVISAGNTSFYTSMRRTYASFEAWVNEVNLNSPSLRSFSQRVSGALDCTDGRIWTTAPCMQPMLENGLEDRGGLLDPARVQRMFPSLKVHDVQIEEGRVVIQSEYENGIVHYTACNGAFEHRKVSQECCCCYRIDTIYDRLLCCEFGQGTCSSMSNSGDACGIVSCGCGGVGACCCYAKEDNNLVTLNTGCFGPEGLFYSAGIQRVRD